VTVGHRGAASPAAGARQGSSENLQRAANIQKELLSAILRSADRTKGDKPEKGHPPTTIRGGGGRNPVLSITNAHRTSKKGGEVGKFF